VTATEWRDCADPDELAAAVAAGVEVQRMRGGGWVPSALTHRDDFAWFLTHGTRYQLPTWWTWRPEPPAPDELRERIARAMFDRDGFAVRWDEASVNTTARYSRLADAVLAVLPKPPDGCEAVFLPTDVVDHYVSAEPPAGRWERQASFVVNACREAQARRGTATTPPPVPPWPGAVLSGLVDEDGVPTWLAQAPNVLGEAVRTCVDFPWFICGSDNAVTPYWVEVRAPRAVPEPETERVPVWEAMVGERTAISPDGTPMELSHGDVLLYTNNDGMGGFLMYDDAGHAKEKRQPVAPDGTVEVLKVAP